MTRCVTTVTRFAEALVLLVLAAAAPVAHAASALPQPFAARYELLRDGDAVGEASIELAELRDGRSLLETHTRGTRGIAGLAGAELRERSEFHWAEGLPELDSYRYEQDLAWSRKRRSLDADERLGTITGSDRDKPFRLQWEPGVIDRHTIVLALAADLARIDAGMVGGAAPHDGRLRYRVADKGRIEWHTYRVAGDEHITTPAGAYDTKRIERVREKPGRSTTSWLAREGGAWIPVRIVQREPEGETIELRLVSLER